MDLKNQVLQIARKAKEACPVLAGLNSKQKNQSPGTDGPGPVKTIRNHSERK